MLDSKSSQLFLFLLNLCCNICFKERHRRTKLRHWYSSVWISLLAEESARKVWNEKLISKTTPGGERSFPFLKNYIWNKKEKRAHSWLELCRFHFSNFHLFYFCIFLRQSIMLAPSLYLPSVFVFLPRRRRIFPVSPLNHTTRPPSTPDWPGLFHCCIYFHVSLVWR